MRPAVIRPAQRAGIPATDEGEDIPLDVITLGLVCDRLRKARQELQQACLHVQGHPEASWIVAAVGGPLRSALDAFEAAYARGRL